MSRYVSSRLRPAALALTITMAIATRLVAQSSDGEVRVHLEDSTGRALSGLIVLHSESQHFSKQLVTDANGNADAARLGHGIYQVTAVAAGFAEASLTVEVQSAIPVERIVMLNVATVDTRVKVNANDTLIDPQRAGASSEVGPAQIATRPQSIPGRSLQELVNTQPGWLYEGNAVLHPRGSEYQTQFVVDGIPFTDNRSPGSGPPMNAEDVESLHIYTAGIPAEFGRKMGGVIDVTSSREDDAGLHGRIALSGGSYATAGAYGEARWTRGRDTVEVDGDGDRTDRYLNPVVPQNYTNAGTIGEFGAEFERDFSENDRLTLNVQHSLAHYDIPNELVQQQANQRVTADNLETLGTVVYQHVFGTPSGENMLAHLQGMVRDTSSDLNSNLAATPIVAFEKNHFREGYFKASLEGRWRQHEWKAGMESDASIIDEDFRDTITDFTQFDPGTPPAFAFVGSRPDLEQAAFVEDLFHAGPWTVRAGLRWDHYQLILNQQAFSPRVAVARYFAASQMVVHASYDRVFQTPTFTNILLSSSTAVASLDADVLRLPVQPSRGSYYEAGISKAVSIDGSQRLRVDANVYRRDLSNFADDDQLLNTAVSFPISFRKAVIYGAETKLEMPVWCGVSGFLSYAYQLGNVWFPVNGGLFLGQQVVDATTQLAGHFPDSQDQRHTGRSRVQYQVRPRWWVAGTLAYNTGLPFDFQGTAADAQAQYGKSVLNRLNFDRGRIRPNWLLGASSGVELYSQRAGASEAAPTRKIRLQIDGENLTNELDVIDFGGLFSGNAIGPGRSVEMRLTGSF